MGREGGGERDCILGRYKICGEGGGVGGGGRLHNYHLGRYKICGEGGGGGDGITPKEVTKGSYSSKLSFQDSLVMLH